MQDTSTSHHSLSHLFKKPHSLRNRVVLCNVAIFLLCLLLLAITIIGSLASYGQLFAISDAERNMLLLLIGAAALAVVLFALLSTLVTHHMLRPLVDLGITLSTLGPQRPLMQLAPTSSADEIQDLTTTFNSMIDRLEASGALHRDFVAAVSHELRTPLTAIGGQVDVLLMDPYLTGSARQDVQQIHSDLGRVSRLLTNLLMSTRAEIGIVPAISAQHTRLIHIDTLLTDIVRQFQQDNTHVLLELAALEQASVQGDADLIKHLVLTLLDHALRVTPNDGLISMALHSTRVMPAVLAHKKHPVWATIDIRDSGPGMTADEMTCIFEPSSFSLGGKSKRAIGSDLFVCRLIADTHGGTITVESPLAQGSCFHIWLPIR